MRIAGIDPALTVTGYGVIDYDNKGIKLIEAGIIRTSAKESLPERLGKIHRGVLELVRETKPEYMVLEKLYAHYRHPTTAYVLGQARGVICLVAAEIKIPLIEYPATRVKKAIVGKGLAAKYQIQMMVAQILKLRNVPKYNDVTDALALAIAHTYFIRTKVS